MGSSTDQNNVTKRTLYYGAGGNLVYDQRVGGSTYNYTFNHHNQMVGVQVGGAYVGTYGFDASGARVWRQATSPVAVNNQYVYDEDGHLLMEQNGSTYAVAKEYVWLDDMPLAMIDYSSGAAVTYYIHTGPVNEPLALTNASQATVWSAYVEPFGIATTFSPPSETIDLRLPGQWLSAEMGNLNHNGFRDYDPTLGRYIQADPLGLAAGQNRYPYVDGDPLDWIDPWGLDPVGRAVGGVIGGALGGAGGEAVEPLCGGVPGEIGGATVGRAIGSALGDWVLSHNKPPKDACDPNGAKAPGKPGKAEGFSDPKGGPNWVPNPNGRGNGWQDSNGDVWVPTGQGGSAHGGPHWDKQTPGGGYTNVYPGGGQR